MIKKLSLVFVVIVCAVSLLVLAQIYKEFFHYIAFSCFTVFFAGGILWFIETLNLDDSWRQYQSKKYLQNLGWTGEEFDQWMKKERLEMTDEEFKKYYKNHLGWWFSYVNLNWSNKKVPKK